MNILQRLIPVLVIMIAIVGVGAAGYFGYKYKAAQDQIQNIIRDPETIQKAEAEVVKNLVAEVGKLIELPTGEDPTVATVTDAEKLKDQPFFARAKNGDKVLIYTNAKKAILYDPIARKIIDVAPVNIGTPSATLAQPRIVIRNGTTTVGLGSKVETDLKKDYSQLNVVNLDKSAKDDYDTSVIVVLNDSAKVLAGNLAKTLNISVSSLPQGESKPDADILIILGKDKAQ